MRYYVTWVGHIIHMDVKERRGSHPSQQIPLFLLYNHHHHVLNIVEHQCSWYICVSQPGVAPIGNI